MDDKHVQQDSLNDEEPRDESPDELDEKDKVIMSLQKELEQFDDKYKRVYADFENAKRRMQKDKESALEYANESLVSELLPALDSLEGAIKASVDNEAILSGLRLASDLFMKALGKCGVEVIHTDGHFDPELHECVMQVKSDDKQDGDIVQVLQTGYRYKDRILRPTLVSVAKS